jgi:hypothetical protein
MGLFDKTKKLTHQQFKEIAAFCGGVAILLLVTVFIAGGGTARIGQSIAENGISPQSLTAAVFPCSWFGDCSLGGYTNVYDFYASPTTVTAGQSSTLVWTAYRTGPATIGLCQAGNGTGRLFDWHCYITPPGAEVGNGSALSGSYVVTPTAGSHTYTFCSRFVQDNGGSCLTATVTATVPLPPTPTLTIDAGAGNGVTKTVDIGTPVTITGTFTAASGDTITHTSLVDYQSNALPGINTAVPPTTKSYIFTPTDVGSYIFYPSVQTNTYPSWNNYSKSVTVKVTQPVLGPCNDIPLQTTVPNGCVTPVPAPGICTPTGGSYSAGTNTCSCPAGQHLAGTACVVNPLCANGLADSYAPSCTCPAGKYQPLGSSVCVALPICANGLSQAYSPTCTCPSGQAQKGASCVLKGTIVSFTANPSRVLKGNTATLTWSTSNMATCALSSFAAAGTLTLSHGLSSSLSPIIDSKTIFTLSCVDAADLTYSSSVTVNLIPQTIEQ